jgi:hypothetical protein
LPEQRENIHLLENVELFNNCCKAFLLFSSIQV